MFKRLRKFIEDILSEFRKVQWPTREATLKSTGVVLSVSLVIAVYLGIADLGLANLMKQLISG
ncbi:MAG: preprotein translocase subunit SecE [SAR324 cluster bacterium]|jgi:preprotein translocase subunit SecE|nr:preprotein translocase subunit SecE [Deltaproteobacteria bacterium]MDP7630931.1 preprotein translocase subunit SecE [SAR324 cluster bacterium]MEC7417873.1 preprotein translocase subunit SecE [SAR324 cluster bacterium]HIF68558.1 preprotein translocase subunit SecE [Candidatus Lambdaproteobacteria bacterium]HIL16545.1 preprotein translocase subunit SecE [Deltaproteobacteria bacterium]|tara:strand:- start:83 stop:271 length:189 start_codon:yes stop_codon:yes gene_type:complete